MKCIDGNALKNIIKVCSIYFMNKKEEVDRLNVFPVPDGDTGSNMAYTLEFAAKEVEKASDKLNDVLNNLSKGALLGARGNSGVILSQIFRGFSKQLINLEKISTSDFAKALKNGSNTAYKAVIKPIEGTILTVSRESADEALRVCKDITEFEEFFERVIESAERSLLKTPELLPILKQAGVVDSGGMGYLYILTGMLEAIKGNYIPAYVSNKKDTETVQKISEITFRYCTEILVKAKSFMSERLKEVLPKYGDSLIVVTDEDLIKVHIHTNNPGLVLEEGLKIGELIKIKIDNMKIQHQNTIQLKETPIKKYGILAVVNGEGIKKLFSDLGCDVIIDGGQTMNPSTNDIINGINHINAENIIIFPNNKNIIMTCEQAKNLSDKNIYVIPTKSFNEAISAIVNIDINKEVDDVIKGITKSIESVKTIDITYSIRDSKVNGIDIKAGDILGFVNGVLEEVGNDYNKIAQSLISKIINNETSIITIYYGKDISEKEANEVAKAISFDGDIEIHYGGQPLYYYVISLE